MNRSIVLAALVGVAFLAFLVAPVEASPDAPGYVEMPPPSDDSYVLVSPYGSGRAWGRPETIRFLSIAATEWKRRYPEGPALRIGDISKPDGSTFPPHKTHKDGLSIDLTTRSPNLCHIKTGDSERSIELARLLVSLGARRIFYNDPKVIEAVPEVRKLEKHDDHFHVIVQPELVPEGGVPIVVPDAGVSANAWVGGLSLDEDQTGLVLSWRVLGVPKGWAKTARVEVQNGEGGVLHESEPVRVKRPVFRLPVALEHGHSYRWRVTLAPKEGTGEPVSSAWSTFRCDLQPPVLTPVSPKDGATTTAQPELAWTFEDVGAGEQVRFQIEVSRDKKRRRKVSLPEVAGAATKHTVSAKLPVGREYGWRVVAWDGAGNRAESAWATFVVEGKAPRKRR